MASLNDSWVGSFVIINNVQNLQIEAIMNTQPKVVWFIRIFTRKFAQIEFYWEGNFKRKERSMFTNPKQ